MDVPWPIYALRRRYWIAVAAAVWWGSVMSGAVLAVLWGLGRTASAIFGWALVTDAEAKVEAWRSSLGGWGYVVAALAIAAPGIALYAAARSWKADTGASDTMDELRLFRMQPHPQMKVSGLEVLAAAAYKMLDPTKTHGRAADIQADAVLCLIFDEKLEPFTAEDVRANNKRWRGEWDQFINLLRLHDVIEVKEGDMWLTESGKRIARRAQKAAPKSKWALRD